MSARRGFTAALGVSAALVGGAPGWAPRAQAVPAPEAGYLYDLTVRRHYGFSPGAEVVAYRRRIFDQQPGDEFAANYLVSNTVNLLCPDQIWWLRDSAAGYVPPAA